MRLILVRHGETEFNLGRIMQGHANSGLTPRGKMQAEQLAKRLSKEKIDVIYSSDLKRCEDTIRPFLNKTNIQITFHRELRERNYGIFDGEPADDFLNYMKENGFFGDYSSKPPGGENLPEVQKRMMEKINEILDIEHGKTILVVTHGGAKTSFLLGLFNEVANNETYSKYSPGNTAVTVIEFDEEKNPKLIELNSIEHLEADFD
ncbi:histidine phosphatase family protein [archaeon]|jgi:broad specificity phosphatase PhoE|nr:histidine phosphatase family protein [archaeon]MBT6182440.1 histidine phosphatase family protein [archaeon]MBT6606341.1 histidine phosphatase family protein [archaeon]MBT7251490.1 histidine phosphatase family protein [archaeon]MBT7660755.1 histidine phosphatase family protein [archaeon]